MPNKSDTRAGKSKIVTGKAAKEAGKTIRKRSDADHRRLAKACENQLNQYLHTINTCVLIMLDASGRVVSWNQGAKDILGYEEEEIIGKHFSYFFTDEQKLLGLDAQEIFRATEFGRYSVEGWRVRKDNSVLWAKATLIAIQEEGELLGFFKIVEDLTEKRLSDEALEKSLKTLKDMKFALDESSIVAITDAKGIITYTNKQFCEISKYTSEELIGKTHKVVNSGYHSREFFKTMWQTISKGRVWRSEIRNQAKDGSYYWVDTTIVPFLDAKGKPYQYISIRNDISVRKRIEAELRQLGLELENRVTERTLELNQKNKALEEAAQTQETFVAALTHDLRTPLVGQKRVLEIFEHKKDKFPTDLVPMIGTLLKSNQDLLDLINKLLEIYQYEAGHAHLHVETFTILQILQVALDDIHPLASAKQIEVTQSVPKALKIRADYSQIKRVLVNLLGNAVENIPPGSIIHVSAREEKAGGVIRIQDNGPGIAEELLPGLFNRYFTMGQKNKKIGSGLGLSICKMIMDLHGATIAVSSSPTSGTCFTLTFPKPES